MDETQSLLYTLLYTLPYTLSTLYWTKRCKKANIVKEWDVTVIFDGGGFVLNTNIIWQNYDEKVEIVEEEGKHSLL